MVVSLKFCLKLKCGLHKKYQIIAEISRLLQVAIITGTDVVDNLRLIEIEEQDDVLVLTEEYVKCSERNIEALIEHANKLENGNG